MSSVVAYATPSCAAVPPRQVSSYDGCRRACCDPAGRRRLTPHPRGRVAGWKRIIQRVVGRVEVRPWRRQPFPCTGLGSASLFRALPVGSNFSVTFVFPGRRSSRGGGFPAAPHTLQAHVSHEPAGRTASDRDARTFSCFHTFLTPYASKFSFHTRRISLFSHSSRLARVERSPATSGRFTLARASPIPRQSAD